MLASMVLSSFVTAPAGLFARRVARKHTGWVLAVLPLALFLLLCLHAPAIIAGAVITETYPWAANLGVELAFVLDGLSLLFSLIITGIGTLIVIYTNYYLAGDSGMGRFYLYLLIFMGSMLGLVLAGNILTMFVFWELTSASSYLLIGYKHEYPEARRGAQQGLLITAGGGLALLFGLLLLGEAARSVGVPAAEAYTFQAILAAGEQIRATDLYVPALILIFLGCFTKSAQFPFHFWLPNAMQAPTPASAFLHSATMVKAGVYLLARLSPGLGGTAFWSGALIVFGGITMVWSAILALRQYDIKGLLAYSTLSKLGTLVLLIGLAGEYAFEAVVTVILAHALYKSALFMVAGIVDHEAGTRDLRMLGGLRRHMPIAAALAIIAALSMAGIPVLFGFVAKEWQLKAALESPLPEVWSYGALAALLVSAILTIAYSWRLVNGIFFGEQGKGVPAHVHEAPRGMLLGPLLPTALSVILPLGLLPALSHLLQPAAAAIAAAEVELHLYLWEGITPAFLLSVLAIVVGVAVARFERRVAAWPSPLPGWLNTDRIYDQAIDGVLHGSKALTVTLQAGRLRTYVVIIILTFLAIVGPLFLLYGTNAANIRLSDDTLGLIPHEVIAALLIAAGVVATIRARSRVGAIISLGVVGAMISLFFVLFSAPDLALTQLLIEVLLTVFLLLVFSVLPASFESLSSRATRIRDGIIAIGVGCLMAGLAFVSAASELFTPIAPFFLEESIPGGKGHNVVNVILVDFRSLDTLGEIIVLFIAALGIYGLLRLRSRQPADTGKTAPDARQQHAAPAQETSDARSGEVEVTR